MNSKLVPFAGITVEPPSVSVEVQGGKVLSICYQILGRIESIKWPPFGGTSTRSPGEELWRTTCLEAFVYPCPSPGADPQATGEYWEMNVSPKGAWNLYHFSSYRQRKVDVPKEDGAKLVISEVKQKEASLLFGCQLTLPDLPDSNETACELALGLSVILELDGPAPSPEQPRILYYALTHPRAERPDFHLPAGFVARVLYHPHGE